MMTEMKRRCQGLTKAGRACRAWALRPGLAEEVGDRRALCRVHAEQAARQEKGVAPGIPVGETVIASGTPVPAGTLAGAHGTRQLYGVYFEEEEIVALEALVAEALAAESVTAEVEVARIIVRRLLAYLAETGDLVGVTPLILKSVRTVAQLLRDKQVLGKGGADLKEIIGGALDILNDEWGTDL